MFLFQGEADVLKTLFADPQSAMHPFILLPLAGQILLVITLLQKTPGRLLTYLGMTGIGVLLLFMFFIGFLGSNFKILLSTLPFLITAFFVIRHNKKMSNVK